MKLKLKISFLLIIIGVIILSACAFLYKKGQPNIYVSGVVVPHHNLVANLRAKLFSDLASNISPPRTIILLSPNHYSAGFADIQTTDKYWRLGEGQISPNKKVIDYLVKNNLADNETPSFAYEHGIFNILADIHNNFPKASIVPIIFKNSSREEINKLEKGLMYSCPKCLVIASVDFSHYMPTSLPQTHDERSIKDLQTSNTDDIFEDKDVDSGPALALLTLWAKNNNTDYFNFIYHTDSGANTKDYNMEATTHVFGWYEK